MIQSQSQRMQTNPKNHSGQQLTFQDHLVELRNRLFVVAAVLIAGTLLGYSFHKELAAILMGPLQGERLVYLTPSGGFDFIFRISLYFGLLLTLPTIIYSIYKYLTPLMKRTSRSFLVFLIFASFILGAGGIIFGYFVAVPSALHFLTTFAEDYVTANLTASSYLNFVTLYMLGLAALFQLPLILMIINSVSGPIGPKRLLKTQKFVLLATFILAAMITPTPDIYNQLIVAAPIIAIYQLGVIAVMIQNKFSKKAGTVSYFKNEAIVIPQDVLDAVSALKKDPMPSTPIVTQSNLDIKPQSQFQPQPHPIQPRLRSAIDMDFKPARRLGARPTQQSKPIVQHIQKLSVGRVTHRRSLDGLLV